MTFKIIQKFKNQVPSMATCTGCDYKFLTPNTLNTDRAAAELYLADKYGVHRCGSSFDRPPSRMRFRS